MEDKEDMNDTTEFKRHEFGLYPTLHKLHMFLTGSADYLNEAELAWLHHRLESWNPSPPRNPARHEADELLRLLATQLHAKTIEKIGSERFEAVKAKHRPDWT